MTYKECVVTAKKYDFKASVKRPFLLLENELIECLIGINTKDSHSGFYYGKYDIPFKVFESSQKLITTPLNKRGEIYELYGSKSGIYLDFGD